MRLLNEGYATRITKGRPFVTLKMSLSADGMVGNPLFAAFIKAAMERRALMEAGEAPVEAASAEIAD